jgi:hypothetical protein
MKNIPTCCDCGTPVARKKVKRCKQCNIKYRTLSDEEKTKRKELRKKYKAEYYQKNKNYISKRCKKQREWLKEQDPDALRLREFSYFLRWKYGMELEDYEKILSMQNGCCAICGYKPDTFAKKENKLYVDHNHKTKKVRGLLCMNCNSAIGHLNEDLTILQNAIEYLKKDNEPNEKISVNPENNGNPAN